MEKWFCTAWNIHGNEHRSPIAPILKSVEGLRDNASSLGRQPSLFSELTDGASQDTLSRAN
jgi:hypothetical protein